MIVAQSNYHRLPPSSLPCADAYSNAEFASFKVADSYRFESKKYKHFSERGFIFGAVGITMYLGDSSQNKRLCTSENLNKLELINRALELPLPNLNPYNKHEKDITYKEGSKSKYSSNAKRAEKALNTK